MAVQDYIDHVLSALPKWFSNNDREYENIKAFAEIFQKAQDQNDDWREQTYITTAVGTAPGEPDWLSQHAVDRDTGRQDSETDVALRDRLRTFQDSLNLTSLLAGVQAILDAEGIVGTAVMYALRPNRIFFTKLLAQSGTGGTFTGAAPDMVFTPDTALGKLNPKYDSVASHQLVLSGSATPANDGTAAVDSLSGDGLAYQNASGATGVDGGVSWRVERLDASGNVLDGPTGRQQAYLSRGYRLGISATTLLTILPFGCTEATRQSVIESLRQKKGAGVRIIVECRENP